VILTKSFYFFVAILRSPSLGLSLTEHINPLLTELIHIA